MDEDKKINPDEPEQSAASADAGNEIPADDGNKAPAEPGNEAAAETGENLKAELEDLRDTFQKTYDETVEEARSEPVIQELEDGSGEEPDIEDGDDSEETEEEEKTSGKKKKKKGKTAGVVIAVILCIVVIAPLLTFFVLSVTQPDFSAFISSYTKAASAEKYEDRVKFYQEALGYCSGDSLMQKAMSNVILEQVIVDTYKEKDYASAYSLMSQIMTDEQISHPSGSEFKKFLKLKDSVADLSVKIFPQIIENIGDSTELPADDILLSGLEVPENVENAVTTAAKSFAEGYIFDKSAEGIEDYLVAVNYYVSAYSNLTSIGADPLSLAENICLELYNRNFIFEAASMAKTLIKPDMKSENADFNAMLQSFDIGDDFTGSVYATALDAYENEKTDRESISAAVSAQSTLDEKNQAIVTDMIMYALKAVAAEKENNLTKAASVYTTLQNLMKDFGMSDFMISLKNVESLFDAGNLPEAMNASKEVFTDENKAKATEEQLEFIEKAELTFAALTKTTEAFGPFINNFYQSGTPIDFDEASKVLDALLTESSNKYDRAFVDYCKYFAAEYAEDNENGEKIDSMQYIRSMQQLIPDQPFVYGGFIIQKCLEKNDFEGAATAADYMLAKNIADEYANSIVALSYRAKGDLDKSLQAALRGMELSGKKDFCASHAAIAYMLKGDFETAFGYIDGFFKSSASIEACDLILIFNHLYKGENEDILSSLKDLTQEVENLYKQYGVKSYKDTLSILDDSKTLEDIFLSGDYDFAD